MFFQKSQNFVAPFGFLVRLSRNASSFYFLVPSVHWILNGLKKYCADRMSGIASASICGLVSLSWDLKHIGGEPTHRPSSILIVFISIYPLNEVSLLRSTCFFALIVTNVSRKRSFESSPDYLVNLVKVINLTISFDAFFTIRKC